MYIKAKLYNTEQLQHTRICHENASFNVKSEFQLRYEKKEIS